MTNDEPLNNSHPNLKSEIDWLNKYKLPYNKTKWGLFYTDYKEQGQLQLQKALEKNKNEIDKIKKLNKYERLKYTQHLFYQTEWDEKEEIFKTPDICLKHIKHGYNDTNWDKLNTDYKDKQMKILKSYIIRNKKEHLEVEEFYLKRKTELELEQKDKKKEHANQKVICEFCKANFTRTNLARHKKTNKKCLEIQNLGQLI